MRKDSLSLFSKVIQLKMNVKDIIASNPHRAVFLFQDSPAGNCLEGGTKLGKNFSEEGL